MDIIKEKVEQAIGLLRELKIDLWLVFVRETRVQADPTIEMVVGHEATWQSLFAFSRGGESVAVVGNLDEADFRASGRFSEVRTYTADIKDDVHRVVESIAPEQIAVNYSLSDPVSDGLTHGMYLQLTEYLRDTVYAQRLMSSEQLVMKLRSRKLPSEIKHLKAAAETAEAAWQDVISRIRVGMTEIEVAQTIEERILARSAVPSFEAIVNAGDKTQPGHGSPTGARLEPGDLLHVDFGAKVNGYCSDLQRLVYFRRPGASETPAELSDAFSTVRDIITHSSANCRPGIKGWELDAGARETLRDYGYPEYQHALGHQLGRSVHDGGAILGPKWARYGSLPDLEIEGNNVFTLELEIMLPGIGCVGLEEDVCVTESGGEFLCPRQLELTVI